MRDKRHFSTSKLFKVNSKTKLYMCKIRNDITGIESKEILYDHRNHK